MRQPGALAALDLPGWDRTLRLVRNAELLPRLAHLLRRAGVEPQLPANVREHLLAARNVAAQHERVIRWEVNRIAWAMRGLPTKPVLLKGAAYVIAGLPNAHGRLVTDVDIMVPRADLETVERTLLAAGWESMKLNPYDQRYYRTWMHELPPLRHAKRRTVLDVHHTILPETGRLRPDARKLLDAARPAGDSGFFVLAPHDMVLHSAAHLFQDGDLAGGLRDLTDLDDLMRHFAQHEPGFWERFVPRAVEMDLARPAFYALRFCHRLLGTPVPQAVLAEADEAGGPSVVVRSVMDALASRALLPTGEAGRGRAGRAGASAARWMLYARSHWLRMPPGLLLRHLMRKATRRVRGDEP
jgi:hypothetical protein